MLKQLVKIADFLDKHNRAEDANLIDQIISTLPDEEIEIPEDEYQQLLEIQKALSESLFPNIELS